MLLSFIIPVYNGEAHLRTCLSSILREAISEVEVLVINDGSTDNSVDILREYASADNRVRVFGHEENRLVGYCRNIGLENAGGDYVWFVDADDWLSPNSLSQLMRILEQHPGAQVLSFGYAEHYSLNGGASSIVYKIPNTEQTDRVSILNFLKVRTGFSSMPFSYIFRKDFLDAHSIRFPEGIYFEDLYFMGKVFYHARNVRLIQRIFYNYNRFNENSITLVQTKKKIFDLLENYNLLRILFAAHEHSARYNKLLAFRFIVYGLPRCFRMYLCLPQRECMDRFLWAELLKFRKSPLMRLKSLGRAAGMARTLSAKDPFQREIFKRNIRLLLKMKYGFRLVLFIKYIRSACKRSIGSRPFF